MADGNGDNTGRIKLAALRAAHDELEPLAKRVGNLKVILAAGIGLVFAGFVAAIAISKVVMAADFKKHVERSDRIHHRQDKETAVTKALLENVEADMHWQREQQTTTAKRVGARVVEPPKHKPIPQPEEGEEP